MNSGGKPWLFDESCFDGLCVTLTNQPELKRSPQQLYCIFGLILRVGLLSLFMVSLAFQADVRRLHRPIITVLADEVKQPEKNIPRGLGFSFAVLLTTMVATNFSYCTVLSKEESLRSDAVAMLFGQAVHPAMPAVIAILVCLCSIGTLNILILGHPRMIFAAGRNGHMPAIMTMVHTKFHSPWPATIALGFLGIILLVFGSVMSLVETISLYAGFMMLALMMCLFTLRWRHPGLPRPIKVPIIIPILVSVLTVVLVTLAVIEMPWELGMVTLVASFGVPLYYVCVKLQKPRKLFRLIDMLGFYLQVSMHLRYEEK